MHDVSPGLQIQEWIGDNKQDIYVVSVQLIDPAVAQVWITQLCEHFLTCLWPASKPHTAEHTHQQPHTATTQWTAALCRRWWQTAPAHACLRALR